MRSSRLTIYAGGQSWQAQLNPESTIIGRSPACDVVIGRSDVSRRHAKISWSSSNRWIIEDLDSSNGTFVNSRRVTSCPIGPGDIVEIGAVCLSLGRIPERLTTIPSQSQLPKIIIEDFGTEVFYSRPHIEECTRQPCAEKLRSLCRRLSGLSDQDAVYLEICRALAPDPKTAAVILQIPKKDIPIRSTPNVLAYHFGGNLDDTRTEAQNGWDPSHHGLRVSHRLLEAVRTRRKPLMSKSIFSCDGEITISLIDEHSPRALICVPLGATDDAVNLLYVDVPIRERAKPSTEEMFAFVQAVAQHVRMLARRVPCDAEEEE